MLRELVRAVLYCAFTLGIAYLLTLLVEMVPAGGPVRVFIVRAIWVIALLICAVLLFEALIGLVP